MEGRGAPSVSTLLVCFQKPETIRCHGDYHSVIVGIGGLGIIWFHFKEKVSRNTTQGKKEEPNANKKRKSKRKAAAWVGKRVQASGLPSGWLVGRKVSDDGRGSRKYYIQPGTGIVFKSKKEAERFLKQDLGGASKERKEDTPRRELDAWEDGKIDAYEEVENLRRQLQEAIDEKNEFESDYVNASDRGVYSVPNIVTGESAQYNAYFGWKSTSGSASDYHRFSNYMDKCSGGQNYLTVNKHGEVSLRSLTSLESLALADWKSVNPPKSLNHREFRFWVSRGTGKCLTVFGGNTKKRTVGVADCKFDGANKGQLFAFRFHYHTSFCCCGRYNN